MKLTNRRIDDIIRLLESKKQNGQSIELITFNMIKRYGRNRAAVIIKHVYPDFNIDEVK